MGQMLAVYILMSLKRTRNGMAGTGTEDEVVEERNWSIEDYSAPDTVNVIGEIVSESRLTPRLASSFFLDHQAHLNQQRQSLEIHRLAHDIHRSQLQHLLQQLFILAGGEHDHPAPVLLAP